MITPIRIAVFAVCLLCTGCRSDDRRPTATEVQRSSVHPKAAEFMVQGYDAFQQGDYAYALALVDSAGHYAARLADIPFLRGRIYSELGFRKDAEAEFIRVLELDPNYHGAHFNLGVLGYRAGEYERALEHFRLDAREMETAETLVQVGRTLEQLDRKEAAREAYERAILLDRSSAKAHAHLSQLLERENRLEAALQSIQTAVAIDSTQLEYRYLHGYQLQRADRWEEAAAILRSVVAEQPSHQAAHYNLGQALMRLGARAEAEQHLARAESLDVAQARLDELRQIADQQPRDPMHWVHLGDGFAEAGRIEAAAEAYRVALSLVPGSPELHINLANLMLAAGDTSGAASLYYRALALDSTQVDAWYNIGVVHAKVGRTEYAKEAWQRALTYSPEDTTIKRRLAQLADR